jgi:hypothetical protein
VYMIRAFGQFLSSLLWRVHVYSYNNEYVGSHRVVGRYHTQSRLGMTPQSNKLIFQMFCSVLILYKEEKKGWLSMTANQ